MKQSLWFVDRNKELLDQVEALRRHALDEHSPWGVSLGMLATELRKSLAEQVTLLESYEKIRSDLRMEFDAEKQVLGSKHESAIMLKEERIRQLTDRIGEMEKLREEDTQRTTRTLMFKEAELDKLRSIAGVTEEGLRLRRIVRIAATILATALILAGGFHLAHKFYFWRTRSYALPYSRPSAAAMIGGQLFVAEWLTQNVYAHDKNDALSVARVISAQGHNFAGLSGDEKRTYVWDRWRKSILSVNLHGAELEEISALASPGAEAGGLFLEGKVLWSADPAAGKLYRLDLETHGVKEYKVGKLSPSSILRRKERFWILDQKTATVLRNRPGADLDRTDSWEAMTPAFPPDGPQPVAIAADSGSLWILMTNPAHVVRYNFRYLEQ